MDNLGIEEYQLGFESTGQRERLVRDVDLSPMRAAPQREDAGCFEALRGGMDAAGLGQIRI
jgi:hypothetical protein